MDSIDYDTPNSGLSFPRMLEWVLNKGKLSEEDAENLKFYMDLIREERY